VIPRLNTIPGAGFLLLLLLANVRLEAQSLEPRAFAPNPTGVNFILGSWLRTDGDVLLNDSVPIEDFRIVSDAFLAGFGGTFAIGSRLASIGILVPYITGDATGRLRGVPEEVHRSGLGDTSFRFTLSLLPDSALKPAEFRKKPLDRTLAASLIVFAPTGEYYDDKLINLSAHRWAFKPSIGGSRQFGPWSIDGSAGVWLFTDNNEYLENSRREQDPIGVLDANLSYTFAPRLWLSGSVTWYAGGRSQVDGKSRRDSQNNTRAGLTLALPVTRQQSIKLSWGTGTSTRFGGKYDSYLISWQYLWFN
jgi:hypothetical protein